MDRYGKVPLFLIYRLPLILLIRVVCYQQIIAINSYLCCDRRTDRTKKNRYNSKFTIIKVKLKSTEFGSGVA